MENHQDSRPLVLSAPFHSPGPMHSLMDGIVAGNSNDYSEMYPFEITKKSRQAFCEGSNHGTEPLTPSNGLFHDYHDLKFNRHGCHFVSQLFE